MAQATVTEGYQVLPAGDYRATLTGIYDVEGKFADAKTGKVEPALRWEFALTDGPHAGYVLFQFSSCKLGPRCKARAWTEKLMGQALPVGQVIDFDAFVGVDVHIRVDAPVGLDGVVKNTVTDLRPAKPTGAPTTNAASRELAAFTA